MPVGEQMRAVTKYLRDAGVRPGMGMLDIYAAINAGHVGRYNASDAHAGGAPGTVRDKVEKQMGAHRRKAQALLQQQAPSSTASSESAPSNEPVVHHRDGSITQGNRTFLPKALKEKSKQAEPKTSLTPLVRKGSRVVWGIRIIITRSHNSTSTFMVRKGSTKGGWPKRFTKGSSERLKLN